MLQWMGGSRRKVTASRKSTQKRQQQFFEQRKRQQQQQEATVESHNDSPLAGDNQKGNRSLDILSFLNVPKVSDEGRTSCGSESTSMMTNRSPSARFFEAVDTRNHQSSMTSPIEVTNVVATADYVEPSQPTGTRTPLSHQAENVSSKSAWKNTSMAGNADSKCWRIDSSIHTSILDIIGDDGPANTSDGKPVHEAHVAFSVEGLGDLGTETPKHSPQQPARISCGDKSSLSKAAKKLHFRKNLNVMLDDLETETDTKVPIRGNHLDSFPISEDVLSPFSYTRHGLSPVKAGKKLCARQWETNSLHEDRDTDFWNAGSSFLDDDIVDGNGGLNWKNDGANILRNTSSNFGSEEPHLRSRSQHNISGRYNDLDEGDRHFRSLEEPKYSSFMCDYKPQATRFDPYAEMDDRRENLTSLSEESCSSSAVRGRNNVAGMPSGIHLRRYGEDPPWQLNSNPKENLHEQVEDIMAGAMRRGQECDRSRKFRRSSAGHTNSAFISQSTVNTKFLSEDSCLLDEQFPLDSDPGSYIPASDKNRHWSRGSDPFGTNGQADLRKTSSCCFGTSKNKTSSEFSPENISFFQPFCSTQSFHTSISSGGSYRESLHGVHHGINIPVQSSNSADVADFFGDTEAAFPVPELSAQGSVTEEVGDKLESNPEKITPVSAGNLNISQESESTAGETSTKEDESSFCKEKNSVHQEMITYSSEEDAKETPLPVKIQHALDGELNTKELQRRIPVLCPQNVRVSVADVGGFITTSMDVDNRKAFKAKTKLIEPSCQVMTVERYVLQLMCVSKGKGATWDTTQRWRDH